MWGPLGSLASCGLYPQITRHATGHPPFNARVVCAVASGHLGALRPYKPSFMGMRHLTVTIREAPSAVEHKVIIGRKLADLVLSSHPYCVHLLYCPPTRLRHKRTLTHTHLISRSFHTPSRRGHRTAYVRQQQLFCKKNPRSRPLSVTFPNSPGFSYTPASKHPQRIRAARYSSAGPVTIVRRIQRR